MEIPTLFFERHPNPMLVFDANSLQILQVNSSAVKKYGFSESEFTQLTIGDIHPPESLSKLRNTFEQAGGDTEVLDLGTFRHQTKKGTTLHVQLTTQRFPHEERKAGLVHINDISELVRLKQKVEEAYRDQRQHIENNPLGMVKYDANFRIVEWSKRAEGKTGYSKDEVLGSSMFELGLLEESETEFIQQRMQQISSSELNNDRFETVLKLKNGGRMEVLIHASALHDKQNNLKSVLAFIENISERKEYERELEKRERKYHRLFEDANDGIFLMKGMTFIDCNERITEILAGSKEEIIGKTPLDFSPARQPDNVLSQKKARQKIELVKAGKPQVFEWRHRNMNGDPIDVEISLNEIDLGEGDYLQAVVRDLTKIKRMEQELKRREQLFESLFVNSPVAIAMIDRQGKVQKLNKSFTDLFGYTEEELLGKDLLQHQLPEERYDEIDKIYEHVFAREGTSKYYEDQRITKEGAIKDLLVGALPVIIEGEEIAAFGIYTDITKLRATEEELKESLHEKEILLSEIHHRVKNNLAIISGLLLLEAMNWEKETEVHKVLIQSKLRIHSMAKIHEKLYESNDFANLNLENYISELVDTIYTSVNGKQDGVDISLDCDQIKLNINQALPSALIVNELVTNSFKYAFEDEGTGQLDVQFKEEDNNTIRILVQDDGPGLPSDFEQMTEESLGHRLVSQLVKQLDGTITVETAEQKGTRYEIKFKKEQKSGSASSYFT